MEVLHEPPTVSSFVTLAEHQSHTPASFYSGPPILHHLSERCKVVILERDLTSTPALSSLRSSQATSASANGASTNGPSAAEAGEDRETTIEGVNVWVSSEKLLLYSPSAAAGVAIRYPSVSLHAIQRLRLPNTTSASSVDDTVQGLYMQLASTSGDDADEEEESITLTIVPDSEAPTQQPGTTEQPDNDLLAEDDKPNQTPTEALFAAVSACSNLHPDPIEGDEDEEMGEPQIEGSALFQNGLIIPGNNAGGLPPPMPGSGGWITADNVDDYFDEEGNWKGETDSSLGTGAGSVRPREDGDDNDNGEPEGGNDAGGEETKWRRTG